MTCDWAESGEEVNLCALGEERSICGGPFLPDYDLIVYERAE